MIEIQYIRTATVLLRWDGFIILTDPWFAMQMRGLPVFVRPCVKPENLPAIDLVLVSHFHPDHFDKKALLRLSHPIGRIVGPAGIEQKSAGLSFREVVTLADGEKLVQDRVTIHSFCVEHSGYENAYVLERKGQSIFFAGDASYSPVFSSIGQRHAPLLSLLPVGGTRIFGRRIVMNPADAYRAAIDLNTRIVVPIHLGGEWMSVPPLSLHPGRAKHLAALAASGNAPFEVAVLAPGKRVTIGDDGNITNAGVHQGGGHES